MANPRKRKVKSQSSNAEPSQPKKKGKPLPKAHGNKTTERAEAIERCFLCKMPHDFFDFWELCCKFSPESPSDALQAMSMKLAGPFDLLSGAIGMEEPQSFYLLHHRYYYDVPEFQTVLKSTGTSSLHVGYYRDDPKADPAFVGSNSGQDETIRVYGDNLFAATYFLIKEMLSKASKQDKAKLGALCNAIQDEAQCKGYSLVKVTPQLKKREKEAVCPGWHGAGLCVPLQVGGVGYRPLPETQRNLKAIFTAVCQGGPTDRLEELLNFVHFANDECDYGMGLEFGLAMFCFGGDRLHQFVRLFLGMAYDLLHRSEFKSILLAHLDKRESEIA